MIRQIEEEVSVDFWNLHPAADEWMQFKDEDVLLMKCFIQRIEIELIKIIIGTFRTISSERRREHDDFLLFEDGIFLIDTCFCFLDERLIEEHIRPWNTGRDDLIFP